MMYTSNISLHADLRALDPQTCSFTLRQIKLATNNFDAANTIGEGGFGPVYKVLELHISFPVMLTHSYHYPSRPKRIYNGKICGNLALQGVLSDGTPIAVKQPSSNSKQGSREFVNEIGMVSALRHPHLVKFY